MFTLTSRKGHTASLYSLPDLVTSASAPSVAVFRSRLNLLKTQLFNISFPLLLHSACAVTLVAFVHYNRSGLLVCYSALIDVGLKYAVRLNMHHPTHTRVSNKYITPMA